MTKFSIRLIGKMKVLTMAMRIVGIAAIILINIAPVAPTEMNVAAMRTRIKNHLLVNRD